jgi:tripartite-type tricarboxylate transporter receptor subunit TctC
LTYKIVHPEVSFDMIKDYAPVALLASGPLVMAVDPKLGVNSVKEFTALAKSKPGQILFGTVGPGSLPDLAGGLYAQCAGVKLVQVPYPGSPQVTTDLIGRPGHDELPDYVSDHWPNQNWTDQGASGGDR